MKESNTLNPSKKIILSFYTIMEERELYLDENFCDKSLASMCGCSLKELDRFSLEEFGLTAAGIISMYREQHC